MMPVLSAQDGAAIYKERCASCHDMPAARVPSLTTIKAMSGEAIYIALTSGVMKTRAEGLSTAEIFALIGYIAPTGGHARGRSHFHAHLQRRRSFSIRANSPQWNGWSTSLRTRDFRMRPRRGSRHPTLASSS